MEEEKLFSISWTNSDNSEDCNLRIYGIVDKMDQIYYKCLLNREIIMIKNDEGRWINTNGKDNELAAKLGKLISSCDFLLETNLGRGNTK